MKQRAFTLLEVCLGSTLTLILGLVMLWALIPVLRYSAWGYGRAEVVQATALLATRVVTDLRTAPFEAIRFDAGVLGIHGIVGVTATGTAVWDDHVVCYSWDQASASLARLEWKDGVAQDAPCVLEPAQLRNCFRHPNRSLRRLSHGILREFKLIGSSLPLKLRMVTEVAVPGRPPERYLHEQEITLRSGTR